MNLPISFFDEIFYCSIVGDANYSIVAAVNFIDYAFVPLEQGQIKQAKAFHFLKRHLDDYFDLEPKIANSFVGLFC